MGKLFRTLAAVVRALSPEMETVWAEPFAGEPSVFVCNHVGALGPIDMVVKFPLREDCLAWCNEGIMNRKTCPAYIEDISEIHRTEPYVYSQMVAGKDAPTFGEAKNSWLTGTAAWTFFNISQYILGIQPTLDGLKVDPCIPHTLSGFAVTRRFRGAVYHITVDNAAGVQHGIKAVTVDGKAISGNVLPLAAAGTEVTVQVTMG